MKKPILPLLALTLCAGSLAFGADAGAGFTHKDWELACDNTRTCRAAGYSAEDAALALAMLLTRKAGPGEPVQADVMLGNYGDDDSSRLLPASGKLTLRINGRTHGQVAFSRESSVGRLSAPQAEAVLAVLPGKAEITLSAGTNQWALSDQGAAAVLLKMDEIQGRVGTRGALVKKGAKDESAVLPPLPAPVVIAVHTAKDTPAELPASQLKALLAALRASIGKDDYCPDLSAAENGPPDITLHALGKHKLLASTPCWSGAYNIGHGYWVINRSAPFAPVLVTASGSEYSGSAITAEHKGRGLGDCWSTDEWTWDGTRFIHTRAATTGMCRLIAPGGAWELPRIVTEVRPAPRR